MGFSYLNPTTSIRRQDEVDVQEVLESRQFDPVLDAHLKRNYDEVLELIPTPPLMYSRFVTLTIICEVLLEIEVLWKKT